jgi:hypothetical protein
VTPGFAQKTQPLVDMTKFEHTTAVLQLEKKDFALTRKDVLQGLTSETSRALAELGEHGWDLVAVLPVSSGSAGLTTFAATDAALGFFKRAAAA